MEHATATMAVVPLPRQVLLAGDSRDVGTAGSPPVNVCFPAELEPVGRLLANLLPAVTCGEIKAMVNAYSGGTLETLSMVIDGSIPADQYRVEVADAITLSGGSTQALFWAASTLLQLLERPGPAGTPWRVPLCKISDGPAFPYIGLLVDLARKWHPVRVVKQCIVLCWWYKIKFLHLHFTDDQSFTLPSVSFPRLPTRRRHYKGGEIAALNEFARGHGVTLVPEIDLPGHSRALVQAYPKLFGLKPFRFGRPVHGGVVNIGNDKAFDALSRIVKETCSLFPDTPYFHLGADEVRFEALKSDPDVKARVEQQGLGSVQELYREFITRMDAVVRSCGKQTCVWEGFGPDGKVAIPKDIPVFVFESQYNTADRLVADGHRVVNTSWQPIYVTRRKNWPPETIHAWHPRRWENWVEHSKAFKNPIEIEPTPLLMGTQMCSWEQAASEEIQSLRARVAAFVDAAWLGGRQRDYPAFASALAVQDSRLERVIEAAIK